MFPGPFSFHEYPPWRGLLRLLKFHDPRVRLVGSGVLFCLVVLHTTLGNLVYYDSRLVRDVPPDITNITVDMDDPTNSSAMYYAELLDEEVSQRIELVKLVVVTYQNTGYNLIGSELELYPGSFYWQEPLFGFYNSFYKISGVKQSLLYHGYDVSGSSADAATQELMTRVVRSLRYILDCNVTLLSQEVIEQNYLYASVNQGVAGYKMCIRARSSARTSERNLECLPLLERGCLAATVRSLETTRVSLRLVLDLMSRDPSVKVVYLVQDPRMLMKLRAVPFELLSRVMAATCSELRQDISSYRTMLARYPGRVLLLKAENIPTDHNYWTDQLLRFVGVEPHHSSLNTPALQPIPVRDVITSWRRQLSSYDVMNMQIDCQDVLTYLDYEVVHV